ncbi:hypothetical protein B1A99_24735 [Cohnella sp. CIP 111063]|uniref:hypothetical protein n=1 Tax=unclassified Cohnella TaxID=2636738 RepID=UPI000B8BF799|nr:MULTISPECIES: hypothetical protein [unclassified Cohnella]OXS54990.1 hypothetical protein B1A99_24735 [Cohnella sp. CIP 111063]
MHPDNDKSIFVSSMVLKIAIPLCGIPVLYLIVDFLFLFEFPPLLQMLILSLLTLMIVMYTARQLRSFRFICSLIGELRETSKPESLYPDIIQQKLKAADRDYYLFLAFGFLTLWVIGSAITSFEEKTLLVFYSLASAFVLWLGQFYREKYHLHVSALEHSLRETMVDQRKRDNHF